MTWMKAIPVLSICVVFDALRFVFEQFWFFGPALTAAYCTSKVSDVIGTAVGGLVCGAGATAAGYLGAPVFEVLGVVMAIAVGLLGWMSAGLVLIITNARIFKENEGHTLLFMLSLLISETPIIGSLPGLTGATVKMYHTQIKKDKENMKKYEKETAVIRLQERNQQNAYLMQARSAQLEQADIY
jgi:hypothetical protein